MTKVTHPTILSNLFQHLNASYRCFTISHVLRALQLILAIVIAALYGVDLAHFTKLHAHADANWIYAEFVAAVSAIACLVFVFVAPSHVAWSILDIVIFVLWLAQAGVFGSIFYPEVRLDYADSTLSLSSSTSRMRAAVWIDVVNVMLWLLTAVLRIAWFVIGRKRSRRGKKSKEDFTPILGLLDGRRDLHKYSDQEYGCLDIHQENSNRVDTTSSKVTEKTVG